jgi:hypothetical protein
MMLLAAEVSTRITGTAMSVDAGAAARVTG